LIQGIITIGEAYLWFVLNDNKLKIINSLLLRRSVPGMARDRMNGTVRKIGYWNISWSPSLFIRHCPLLPSFRRVARVSFKYNQWYETLFPFILTYYILAAITALFSSRLCNMRVAQLVAFVYTV
jgi:hypothetical protein